MLQFLWFKEPTAKNPEMVQYRFSHLVFGLRPYFVLHNQASRKKANRKYSIVQK